MIFCDNNLARMLERTEARSNAAFVEARASMTPESGAEWIEVGGAYAMFDGPESPLTQTFGLGVFETPDDAQFKRLEAFFKDRGAPVFHEVSPMVDPSVMATLVERGYKPIEQSSVMFMELSDVRERESKADPSLVVRRIERGEERLWAETSAAGWAAEMPEIASFLEDIGEVSAHSKGGFPYLALVDGAPAAAGMLYVFGETAIVAGASTKPEFRRRGAQSALLAARLTFARDNGASIVMMGAAPGSQSQRNAEKNGFRIAYTRTKWML